MLRNYQLFTLCLLLCVFKISAQVDPNSPNILLIIADDLGVDASNGYHEGNLMPTTPTLDSLRSVGITFENVFSAPVCSPSRAAIMSGKFGTKTGVTGVPGHLDLEHTSIFTELENQTDNTYSDAVIGKWHLSSPSDPLHPDNHNVDYFMGVLSGAVPDYYAWNKTENGQTATENTYVTTSFTNAAIDWVNAQDQPWFLWNAHVAPHTPIHVPPSHMYTIQNTGNNFRKYLAMIESVDYEINRLLYSMSDEVRENTLVIYIGDNGTPGNLLRDYPDGHGKGSLYQGGIRVPMIIAGAGVERQGEREPALIHLADLYATILEVAGAELPGGLYNSLSFDHLFSNTPGATRDYNYSEVSGNTNSGFTIRGSQYKLIEFEPSVQEFYDLLTDSLETNNLMADGILSGEQSAIKEDLEIEALQTQNAWSCRDHIQNGDEEGIDCGGTYCDSPCVNATGELFLKGNDLLVYPNPTYGQITIESKLEKMESIQISNTAGQLFYNQQNFDSKRVALDIGQIKPQMLFIKVQVKNQIQIRKLCLFQP